MENITKEKLINACEKNITITIEYSYSYRDEDSYRYEVQEDGNVLRTHFVVVAATSCSGFGCAIVYEPRESELIGNCDDLSFLS